jgi:hypothetical protein
LQECRPTKKQNLSNDFNPWDTPSHSAETEPTIVEHSKLPMLEFHYLKLKLRLQLRLRVEHPIYLVWSISSRRAGRRLLPVSVVSSICKFPPSTSMGVADGKGFVFDDSIYYCYATLLFRIESW